MSNIVRNARVDEILRSHKDQTVLKIATAKSSGVSIHAKNNSTSPAAWQDFSTIGEISIDVLTE